MTILISFLSGFIFSAGLVISQMINPYKVKGFLDIFGHFDYSLIFVMGGAVTVNLITFHYLKNKKPFLVEKNFLPTNTKLDKKLILGAILFGMGWGLIGICPGPALVNLARPNTEILTFVAAMIVGMFLFKLTDKS